MPHTCKALLIHCMDFRLEELLHKYLQEQQLSKNCDIVAVAGAGKDIADGHGEYLLKQIELSVKLHSIEKLILAHHTDCGAYGGASAFKNTEQETDKHQKDMDKVKQLLVKKYPELEIQTTLIKTP